MNKLHASVGAFALSMILAGPSLAQVPPPPPPPGQPSATAGDDMVVLKDGTTLRGTISEMKPGRSVLIVLVTGESRRIPMTEVAYAGAAAAQSRGAPVPVQLRADKTAVTFYYNASLTTGGDKGSAVTYKRICTAPCEATLPPGSYMMALTKGSSTDPAPVEEPVVIDGPTSMQGTHTSYKGLRVASAVVGIGSAIGGIILLGLGFSRTEETCDAQHNCKNDLHPDWTLVGVGAGVIVVGAIASAIMNKSDTASVRVVPFMTPQSIRPLGQTSTPAGADALSSRAPTLLPGLGLAYVF